MWVIFQICSQYLILFLSITFYSISFNRYDFEHIASCIRKNTQEIHGLDVTQCFFGKNSTHSTGMCLDDTYRSQFANFFNNKKLNSHCYILDLARQILSDECKQAYNWFNGYIVAKLLKHSKPLILKEGRAFKLFVSIRPIIQFVMYFKLLVPFRPITACYETKNYVTSCNKVETRVKLWISKSLKTYNGQLDQFEASPDGAHLG